jgi:hypothetical protein
MTIDNYFAKERTTALFKDSSNIFYVGPNDIHNNIC